MYVPPHFALDDATAWQVVVDAGAGMLVRTTPDGLESVFVPVIISEDRGTIRSHVARANSWWRGVEDAIDVLGLFLAASAYVSPSNYPSRLESPGVVPTWNYVATEVRGRLTIRDDVDWLDDQVRALTDHFEATRQPRWRVGDSPDAYVAKQLRAIVGLEIEVTSIVGKAKLSQNRPSADHEAVRAAFEHGSLAERNVAARMGDDQ